MKRKIFLEDIPLDEALGRFERALREAGKWQPLDSEEVPVAEALGRVTAEPVWARISSPHYNASAMDGFAVRAADTEGATETSPVQLWLVEDAAQAEVADRTAYALDTGHLLPPWANAVVMVEHTQPIEDISGKQGIEIRASVAPWKNVRLMGEDMVTTELVLPANHRLRPVDLGAAAGSGHHILTVYRKPKVAIIPTGSELVGIGDASKKDITPGNIIEYNSIVLAAQIDEWGGVSTRWPIVPDEYDAIREAVLEAVAGHDLVLVNAGSSAGEKDYTAQIVESLGELLVHGVAVRPGHPVILGILDRSVPDGDPDSRQIPIIGVPGYPVSAALTGEIFIEPLVSRWLGQPKAQPITLQATVTRKVTSHTGDDDFLRVALGKVNDRYVATPISRGAGVITSLVRADGIVRIPRFMEGLDAGSNVTVHLYRALEEIDKTIVAIGSHDLALDLLSQFLSTQGEGNRLSSANVGSLGGLLALQRGEAHIAGSHLLDPDSGEYNRSYVQRYVPGREMVIVALVERDQGWIVPKGNPTGLQAWEDILDPNMRIINRQRGAGTRVLLDYQLEKLEIESSDVRGYDDEAYTHLAVAAAVSSGIAGAGLGIAAAARALDLDFVPLAKEEFDLVMTKEVFESFLLKPLLDLLDNVDFKEVVSSLPGYSTGRMGEVRHISD